MTQNINGQETPGSLIGGFIGVALLFILIFWADFGVWSSLFTAGFTGAIIGAMIDADYIIWKSKDGIKVNINYVDAHGKNSQRAIILDRIFRRKGTTYFEGVCLLRHERRTFKVDNITDMYNDNGEIIEIKKFKKKKEKVKIPTSSHASIKQKAEQIKTIKHELKKGIIVSAILVIIPGISIIASSDNKIESVIAMIVSIFLIGLLVGFVLALFKLLYQKSKK